MKKFVRQQAGFKKRIPIKWRKPRGRHSKVREKLNGIRAMPKIGYKKSNEAKMILINNLNDLKNFNKGDEVMISGRVGAKKKIQLLEYCINNKIKVLNYKKVEDKVNSFKDSLSKRVKERKDRMQSKKVVAKKTEAVSDDKKSEPVKKVVVKKKEVVK